MELSLRRDDLSPERTLGRLFLDGVFECHTVEDTVRSGEKIPGETAIPAGRYRVELTFSKRFDTILPILRNVPNFAGIRIHSGNRAEDTAGCIIVGDDRGTDEVLGSRRALSKLMLKIARALGNGEQIWITVA